MHCIPQETENPVEQKRRYEALHKGFRSRLLLGPASHYPLSLRWYGWTKPSVAPSFPHGTGSQVPVSSLLKVWPQ